MRYSAIASDARLAARRERRPVVEVDQRQLAGRSDDDVAAEDVETGRAAASSPSRRSAPRRAAGRFRCGAPLACPRPPSAAGVGIEPVKERAAGDAVELDLVAAAVRLQRRVRDARARQTPASRRASASAVSIHCTSALTDACTSPRFSQTAAVHVDRRSRRRARSSTIFVGGKRTPAACMIAGSRSRYVFSAARGLLTIARPRRSQRVSRRAHRAPGTSRRSAVADRRGPGRFRQRHQVDVGARAPQRLGRPARGAARRSNGAAPASIPPRDRDRSAASRSDLLQKRSAARDVRRPVDVDPSPPPARRPSGSRAPGAVRKTAAAQPTPSRRAASASRSTDGRTA